MSLGVLTEKGVYMTTAPVLMESEDSNFFFRKSKMHPKIVELIKHKNKLLAYD